MEQQKKLKLYSEIVLPGWWPILDKYIPQFRALDPNCEFFIKEKFGYLRIRALSQTLPASAFLELSQQAERESSSVCEYCGQPGKIRPKMSWRKTLCDRCYRLNRAGKNKAAREAERRWIERQEE